LSRNPALTEKETRSNEKVLGNIKRLDFWPFNRLPTGHLAQNMCFVLWYICPHLELSLDLGGRVVPFNALNWWNESRACRLHSHLFRCHFTPSPSELNLCVQFFYYIFFRSWRRRRLLRFASIVCLEKSIRCLRFVPVSLKVELNLLKSTSLLRFVDIVTVLFFTRCSSDWMSKQVKGTSWLGTSSSDTTSVGWVSLVAKLYTQF